jgi:hypothetical protein
MPDAEADEENRDEQPSQPSGPKDETPVILGLSCCGVLGIGAFIGLIVLLHCIHTLGPEDQVVVTGPNGKYVRNGPSTVVLAPERKKVFRHATRLMSRDYAVLKNRRTGDLRHQAGPGLCFPEAYEEVDKILKMTMLQRGEYMRLIDQLSGTERVVTGPMPVMPEPLEEWPRGVEKAVVIGPGLSVLVRVRTTGMMHVNDTGGMWIPRPYEEMAELRNATLLDMRQYALVLNNMAGTLRTEPGPKLVQLGAYEELVAVREKLLLRKDEYIWLKDKEDGTERVLGGPQVFVPKPTEIIMEGKQRATFLDEDTAALVLSRQTGQQRLVTLAATGGKGIFVPSAYEQILEKRRVVNVLQHEAVLMRDANGRINIIVGGSGDASFFLQPFTNLVTMTWSSFPDLQAANSSVEQQPSKVSVTKIDLRSRKLKIRFHAFTLDSVELVLDGNIFWRVQSVPKMVNMTSDPVADVWHHSRSTFTQAVSKTTLGEFMLNLKTIITDAFRASSQDGFLGERGVVVESMEITRFDCAVQSTADTLQSIVQTTVNRANRLEKQAGEDAVEKEDMTKNIFLEKRRAGLLEIQEDNERIMAEIAGDVEGLRRLGLAQSFLDGLNATVPSIETRLDLYKLHVKLESRHEMTHDLAVGSGPKIYWLTLQDLGIDTKLVFDPKLEL